MIKLLFFTLIVYAVYSLPLDETNPDEKQPTDKNDQPSKLSVIQPQVPLNQEHSQYPQHPQQKRELSSVGEHSVQKDDQPTEDKKREAIDENEKHERKFRDTTNQQSEPKFNQKLSERKIRDIKQTDTKPKTSIQTKRTVRSVQDDSGKDLDNSKIKTDKEPPKPFTRQQRHAINDQKPDENVKHIDQNEDHPSKSTVKRWAEKSGDNLPKQNPGNEKKN